MPNRNEPLNRNETQGDPEAMSPVFGPTVYFQMPLPVVELPTVPAVPKGEQMICYRPEQPDYRYQNEDESDWRDWARTFVTVATVLIAGFCFYKALPASWRQITPETRGIAAQPVTERRLITRDIDDYDVGMRALGENPDWDQVEFAPEPDPKTSRKLVLRMKKESGRSLFIKLLRSMAWIESVGAEEGGSFHLDLPEMGAVGEALVEAILPCPPIEEGPGNVVTGTFAHEADPEQKILSVTFSNGAHIKGVTDNHPVYSADRFKFVPIGDMKEGEFVKDINGVTKITRIESRFPNPGEMLYNLETHNEHVYQVTTAGILVHNSCALTRYADDGGHHIFAKRAFEGMPGYKPGDALSLGQSELSRLGLKHLGSESLTTTLQRLFRELAASGRPNTLAEHARIAGETLIEHGVDPKDDASTVRSALNQLKSWGISSPINIPWGG